MKLGILARAGALMGYPPPLPHVSGLRVAMEAVQGPGEEPRQGKEDEPP